MTTSTMTAAEIARETRTFERTVVSTKTRKGAMLHLEMWNTRAQTWRGYLKLGIVTLEITATAAGVEVLRAISDVYFPYSLVPDCDRASTAAEREKAEAALAWIWGQVGEAAIAEGAALLARDLEGAKAKAAELTAEGYTEAAEALAASWGIAA